VIYQSNQGSLSMRWAALAGCGGESHLLRARLRALTAKTKIILNCNYSTQGFLLQIINIIRDFTIGFCGQVSPAENRNNVSHPHSPPEPPIAWTRWLVLRYITSLYGLKMC